MSDDKKPSSGGESTDCAETEETETVAETKESEAVSSAQQEENGTETPTENNEGDNSHDTHKLWNSLEGKIGAVAAVVIIVIGVLFGTHVFCVHHWAKATCTSPRTCIICHRTQGKKLGHYWLPADCEYPKRCGRCGIEVGKKLGHKWEAATCTEPTTCKRCGKTKGSPLGHDVTAWKTTKEATCTESGEQEGTCNRCGQTVTQTIPMQEHTPGDWEVAKDYTIDPAGYVTPGLKVRKCKVCGKVLEQQEYTVELTTSQSNALAKAADYLSFSSFSHESLIRQLEFEGYSTDDATFAADHCGADWMVQAEKKAQSYMEVSSFSRAGLINQLEFEGFTPDQAAHGADSVGL